MTAPKRKPAPRQAPKPAAQEPAEQAPKPAPTKKEPAGTIKEAQKAIEAGYAEAAAVNKPNLKNAIDACRACLMWLGRVK